MSPALAAFSVSIVNSDTISKSGSGDVIGIDADFAGADISIVNTGSGDIHAESTDGLADGIFAYGADITINNSGSIGAEGYTWATGVEAEGDSVTINNRGDISASATANVPADEYAGTAGIYGHAYGIYAVGYGDDGIVVNNRGDISATGVYATGVYAYDAYTGGIGIDNRGDITATAEDGIATGIKTVSNLGDSDVDVSNRGSVEATGTYGASGIAITATGMGASASVDNRGDIYAASAVYYSIAEGIAVSADGDASIRNSGTITIGSGDYAYGALALAFAGDANVRNSGGIAVYGDLIAYGVVAASQNGYADATNAGAITVVSEYSNAFGVDVSGQAGATVSNSGVISASAAVADNYVTKYSIGVRASSGGGDTLVDNSGDITATATSLYAIGASAQSGDGDVWVDNSGSVAATDGKYSFGVRAQSSYGDVQVDNSGTLAGSGKYAYGVVAGSNMGDAAIHNAEGGSITGYSSDLLAVGAFANANYDGSATIDNAGVISATGAGYAQLAYGAVVQTDAGAGLVSNGDTGEISASNSYGATRGVIVRSSAGGDAAVDNAGSISATSTGPGYVVGYYGDIYTVNTDAIGVYVYAPGGTASVDNTGTIAASSAAGLADGVFAAGAVADVTNAGSITADGYTWGAGIEAQGDDAATISNSGDISATTTANVPADEYAGTAGIYGHAYGIYASSLYGDGGVSVDNRGTIAASGVYATGVYAYDGYTGGIGIDNRGDITATAEDGIAAGIKTVSNLGDSDVDVSNRGSVEATGTYGASGIAITATGMGASASVDNRGDIYAASAVYYSIAEGIAVSTDGDASIDNRGMITIGYGDYAYGGLALSFAGDADIDNAGDVLVHGGLDAYGFVAGAQNGQASVTNDGAITTDASFGDAFGIDASSLTGTEVRNNGAIDATASKYAFGVRANAAQGDAEIDNRGTITTDGKYSFAVLAHSVDGDALVDNRGDITGAGKYAYGARAGSTYGDAVISNRADATIIGYSSDFLAVGTFAYTGAGNATIDNRGDINAVGTTYAQLVYGAVVQTVAGDGLVDNRGSINADNSYGASRGVIVRSSGGGDAAVVNRGDISAVATGSGVYEGYYGTYVVNTDVIGVYAYAPGATASVDNSGTITASTLHGLADGVFAAGAEVEVTNSGSITANGYTWGAGIEAQGDDAATVSNTGDIDAGATAYYTGNAETGAPSAYGHAYGIYASSLYGDGGTSVDNRGTIAATGPYATGVYAYDGGTGGIGITNRGDIAASAVNGIASGIDTVTSFAGSDIEIANHGSVTADGYNAAYAVTAVATGAGSGIDAVNTGAISAAASDTTYGIAAGVIASGDGDVAVRNSGAGTIHAYGGSVYGLAALAFAGDADAVNAGEVTATGKYAYGVVSSSQNGTANAVNNGDIAVLGNGLISSARGLDVSGYDAEAVNHGSIAVDGKYSRGISAVAGGGDAEVRNTDSIYAGGKYSYGIAGISTDGDVRVVNTADGTIDAYTSGGVAVGLLGISTYDDVEITNAGDVVARGDFAGLTAGVYASSDNNDVSVVNRGSMNADTAYGNAFGVLANIGGNDELGVVNRGDITVASVHADATGIDATSAYGGEVSLRNTAAISASSSAGNATGLAGAVVGGELALVNTSGGSIDASTVDGDAIGMLGVLSDADVTVNNAGSISVSSTNGNAYAILVESGAPMALSGSAEAETAAAARKTGIAPLVDRNILLATGETAAGTDTTLAAVPAGSTATVINRGSIVAQSGSGRAIAVYGGDGIEKIFNRGTIRGAIVTNGGDDSVVNQRNGDWQFTGTSSNFGAGDDSFRNARGAVLGMDNTSIAFGTGDNSFLNQGLVKVSGANRIFMIGSNTGSASFVNNGVVDFTDGAADDSLMVIGGFGGHGTINLDVSLDNKLNDRLSVLGSTAHGTRQVVNVELLDGLPESDDVGTSLQLVHVSGDTSPSAFVAGKVLGVSPRDFLSMGLSLSAQPDSASGASASGGGSSYMLEVEPYVSGLNAAGVLASSTALAVDSLMSSTIGGRGDRTYMAMAAPGGQPALGLTPWVRTFSYRSGMNPDQLAGNFGQLANAHLNQSNYGTQMGLEYRAGNGFRFGTVFAKSEGRQYLVDGFGRNTIRGHTMGVYGTWTSPKGFYVDASWRTMQFQAHIESIGGRQRSAGRAFGTRLEFGRAWKLGNGLTIAPKVRYTETTVDGLSVEGYQATFRSQGTHWRRASAGVSLQKTYLGASGWQWTPYGEANVVRTLDGVTRYSINRDYFGQVMTMGTSAQVRFGIGAKKGKLTWNGGVNWLDGGNIDGAFGARMTLRYSW